MSTTSDNDSTSWLVDHGESLRYLIVILVSVIIVITVIDFIGDDFIEMSKRNNDYHLKMHSTVLYSSNCETIKNGLDNLLADHANADSWFPSRDDKALKNGLVRYNILC